MTVKNDDAMGDVAVIVFGAIFAAAAVIAGAFILSAVLL